MFHYCPGCRAGLSVGTETLQQEAQIGAHVRCASCLGSFPAADWLSKPADPVEEAAALDVQPLAAPPPSVSGTHKEPDVPTTDEELLSRVNWMRAVMGRRPLEEEPVEEPEAEEPKKGAKGKGDAVVGH